MLRLVFALAIAFLATANAQAAVDCSIGTEQKWSGGFVVKDVVVTNNSSTTIDPWQVKLVFDTPIEVERSWGATIETESNVATATGVDYNRSLGPDQSAGFGLKGKGNYGSVKCEVADQPDPDPDPGDEVYLEDFESYSPSDQWERVDDTEVVSGCGAGRNQCLRVRYVPKSNGSDRLQTSVPIAGGDHYTLHYDILFENGFEFVKGGKLPGLSPDEHVTGCNPSLDHGWSVRAMWRANGSAQGYYYGQDRIERCGDGETSAEGVFRVGQWQHVEVEVKLNSDTNEYDGHAVLRVDGEIVSDNPNIRFRKEISDRSDITRFFFSTFYGGADSSWAPSKTTYIRYDNFRVVEH